MNLPQQDDTSSAERRIIFRWKFVELRWQRWQEGGRSAATRYFMIYKKLTYGGRSARSLSQIHGIIEIYAKFIKDENPMSYLSATY